jgi:hypothetical protein
MEIKFVNSQLKTVLKEVAVTYFVGILSISGREAETCARNLPKTNREWKPAHSDVQLSLGMMKFNLG